jgi:single-strand DNA-binding protein
MYYLNKVQLIGNITQDLEIKKLKSGNSVLNFSIATTRSWFDKSKDDWQKETTFINLTAWANIADKIAKFESKGSKIFIQGRIAVDSYEDKQGNKRTSTKVIVEDYVKISPNTEKSEKPQTDEQVVETISSDEVANDVPF